MVTLKRGHPSYVTTYTKHLHDIFILICPPYKRPPLLCGQIFLALGVALEEGYYCIYIVLIVPVKIRSNSITVHNTIPLKLSGVNILIWKRAEEAEEQQRHLLDQMKNTDLDPSSNRPRPRNPKSRQTKDSKTKTEMKMKLMTKTQTKDKKK